MGEKNTDLIKALWAYDLGGEIISATPYGSGHINDTFLVSVRVTSQKTSRFILQKINTSVFKRPTEVMDNIVNVTEYLKKIIIENGKDPNRHTLSVLKSKQGNNCFFDSHGGVWRCMKFIEGTKCLQKAQTPLQFYSAAKSFGYFMWQLKDYPAHTLFETIKDFHNTPVRFMDFEKALCADKLNRVKFAVNEIDFILKRKSHCNYLTDKVKNGLLPLRLTHNDTKLNNLLIDENTGEGVCVIDLDTIMPGLSVNDFGDAIRFGANTAQEDERDLSLVRFDLEMFEAYTKGYLEAAGAALTLEEKHCLVFGAKLMSLECAIRFLTDFLQGDTYFKVDREYQNLDRARTQLKLVQEMENVWDKMEAIVNKYI
ncbi:MAG: phosphotransferase [Oscillospiraceae bacterium]